MMNLDQWVTGDQLGLPIPADSAALRQGGPEFLTTALRASGALGPDNRVTDIVQFAECLGGSTGCKLLLSVAYEKSVPGLHTDLFVKFSRDLTDPIRDRSKNQLEAEVRLALLSRTPGFPIAVPACYFADYHHDSGTGVLITQRIAFGTNGIERAYEKCRDHEMPHVLDHYKVLLTSVARLAGTQKAGRLAANIAEQFPFDAANAIATDRIRYSAPQLLNRVNRYAELAAKHAQFLPRHITTPQFIAKLTNEVPRFLEQELAIKEYLHGDPDFIALCHWNANVDNAWFWRNARGELECGLMDWGRVGQMNVALPLFGCLSAADIEVWNEHLDELLQLFATELRNAGGPALEPAELKFQLMLLIAMMGLAWLLDAPALVLREFPDLSAFANRFDPRFQANETARVQLHMLTTVLNLWQTQDFGAVLERFLIKCERAVRHSREGGDRRESRGRIHSLRRCQLLDPRLRGDDVPPSRG